MVEEVEPRKKGPSKGAKRDIRRTVIVLAIIGIGGAIVHNRMEAAKKAALTSVVVSIGTVTKEDTSQKISLAGAIATKDTHSIISLVPSGTTTEANFETGDYVVKDQILYRFDSTLVALDVKDVENALFRARKTLANVQADPSGAQSKYGDGVYKAIHAGYMTKVYVTSGEKIGTDSNLVDLVNETTMSVCIPFLSGEAELIQIGSPTTLTLSDTMEQVEGTVVIIDAQGKAPFGGRLVREVTVLPKNPGGITSSTTVSAVINGFRCVEKGKFEARLSSSMIADLEDAMDSVNILVRVGDYIQPGAPVFAMIIKSVKDALQGYSDKVDVAESSVEGTQKTLDSVKETLNNYTIKFPIDGEVITKSYKVGGKISDADVNGRQSAATLVTIYDMSPYNFEMAVDKTDVLKIQLEQHVETTTNALPGETLSGTVTNISLEGISQNGALTYPVQVALDNTEKLPPDMNVSAEILVGSAENALCIPANAPLRDSKVYVRGPSVTEAKGAVPARLREEIVKVGLISADKVQIMSDNFKEGDEVYVQPKVIDSGMMMMNGRAAEGGGNSDARNAKGGGQQSGDDQDGGGDGQS